MCRIYTSQKKGEVSLGEKIFFDFYYGNEADMYSFYRIPKLLFTNEYFKTLTTEAKVLYGLMLDRMSLSIKNKWFDKENRAYIYFTVKDTMELLNCKKNKAIDTIQELDAESGIGLIEKKRQGQGKPTVIYVKSFITEKDATVQKFEKSTSEPENYFSEVGKNNFKKFKKTTTKGLEKQLLEVCEKESNNIKYNNTELNNTNQIISDERDTGIDEYTACSKIIYKNIEMELLYERNPFDHECIDGIYNLILETVLCKSDYTFIARNEYPTQLVKTKFMKLDASHIEYVIGCLKRNTTKVRDIKKYLLAALFNAPATIGAFYQVEFNHDLPQYANK